MIVVDWGTTNLRAYLCRDDGTIEKRLEDNRGIRSICSRDYPGVLNEIVDRLEARQQTIFISGMAGSRNGWREIPYRPAPVTLCQLGASLQALPAPFEGYLVPGIRITADDGSSDVMRGEEVQIFGAVARLDLSDALLCLPGTHSKWARIEKKTIASFMTFMTGDLFQALGQTILACRTDAVFDQEVFLEGLDAEQEIAGGLLHQLFMARTRMLDGVLAEAAVSSFVSGLLVGQELRRAREFLTGGKNVIVVGADHLTERYCIALRHLAIAATPLGSDLATCTGMAALGRHLENIS